MAAQVEVVFRVERHFLSVQQAVTVGLVERVDLRCSVFSLFYLGGRDTGAEGVVDVFGPELDAMPGDGSIVKVRPYAPVLDARAES